MDELRYTLLTDGSSDDALIPIINWLLAQKLTSCSIQAAWADLRRHPEPPRGLDARIREAVRLYPCDVLFVHRDAEAVRPAERVDEINRAIEASGASVSHVRVVPVRMTEAWLLFDERAIRRAAANPNGRQRLALPALRTVENLPDPKEVLKALLRQASGLSPTRLRRFHIAIRRVADLIDDFSPLQSVPAFQQLEGELDELLAR